VGVIGHADRAGPLHDYRTGLVAASGRKSVESMAAITAPERTPAQHRSLLHFVGVNRLPIVTLHCLTRNLLNKSRR
jgi:SRSO17 transposase